MTEKVIRRTAKILARHPGEQGDEQLGDALARVQAASVRHASSPNRAECDHSPRPRQTARSAFIAGVSVHANVSIHRDAREGLERLCRYGLRPALALERLSWTEDGNIQYQYKRPAPDGQRAVAWEPAEFLAKLAAVIPPPRKHLTRYHGVFAPNHAWRRSIVQAAPGKPAAASEAPAQGPVSERGHANKAQPDNSVPATTLARRLDWATLLLRVFAMDVLAWAACGCWPSLQRKRP